MSKYPKVHVKLKPPFFNKYIKNVIIETCFIFFSYEMHNEFYKNNLVNVGSVLY